MVLSSCVGPPEALPYSALPLACLRIRQQWRPQENLDGATGAPYFLEIVCTIGMEGPSDSYFMTTSG